MIVREGLETMAKRGTIIIVNLQESGSKGGNHGVSV